LPPYRTPAASALRRVRAADLAVGYYDWVVAFDHQEQRGWIISTDCPSRRPPIDAGGRGHGSAPYANISAPSRRLPRLTGEPLPRERLCPQHALPGFPDVTSNFAPEDYLRAVQR